MKKILLIIFLLFCSQSYANTIGGTGANGWRLFSSEGISSGSTSGINAADEILAFSFVATTASAITDVNIYTRVVGTVTGQNFKIRIETDDGGDGQGAAPSGSVLGAPTSSFSGVSATGWTGEKTLGTNTGALTIGTRYWVLLYEDGTGSDPDASNYTLFRNTPDSTDKDQWMTKVCESGCTGTPVWTLDDRTPPQYIFKHADSSYSGIGYSCGNTCVGNTSGNSDIFDINKQGFRFKFGSQVIIRSACINIDKAGTPGDITANLYEGDTLKDTITYPETTVSNARWTCFFFDGGDLLSADTFIYVVLSQAGTSDSNDYDIDGFDFNSTYYGESGVRPQNYDFIYGTSATPSSLTVETDWVPRITLIFDSLDTDFDQSGGAAATTGYTWVQ